MGVHLFLVSLYAATAASLLVLGVSLLADVSPLGAAIRAGVAFFAFTVLGLLARAAASQASQHPSSAGQRQKVDFTLPATEGVAERAARRGARLAQASNDAGSQR